VENGASVTDFKWNPFNDHQLAVALDNAVVKIWDIPQTDITEISKKPSKVLRGTLPE